MIYQLCFQTKCNSFTAGDTGLISLLLDVALSLLPTVVDKMLVSWLYQSLILCSIYFSTTMKVMIILWYACHSFSMKFGECIASTVPEAFLALFFEWNARQNDQNSWKWSIMMYPLLLIDSWASELWQVNLPYFP